jgi:fatty acid synthase subunit alpha
VLGVFQKHLTGHPKGPAGAWMINGCLQILGTGLVPGNSNADNVDEYLEQFDYIAFPNRSIQTDGIKAFSVTSFGFGQKGAQMIGVHPKYMFATLEEDLFEEYKRKVVARQRKATAFFNKALISNKLFVAKEKTPFEETREFAQLLDPTVRIRRSE